MAAPVSIHSAPRAASATSALDAAAVVVQLTAPGGRRMTLGTATDALGDRRLTSAERDAVRALVRAVALLRTRAQLAGLDDAGAAVHLVLRDGAANSRGPWATVGRVSIGARNALVSRAAGRARPDVLLTLDTAVHELTHAVQFARMPAGVRPNGAILEGIADSVALLATGDDTLGEGYYRVDGSGRPLGAVREIGTVGRVAGATLGGVLRWYAEAVRPGAEEHAAGGVVSTTMVAIRTSLGRERAETLLWAVIRDAAAWSSGGSWRELALALRRSAAATWPGDLAAAAAVDSALVATGLDAALR